MSEEPNLKPERDLSNYQQALSGWMTKIKPEAKNLTVHDLVIPQGSGFSNETVFYSASWQGTSGEITQRYVARIEPEDGGVFPEQTTACALSTEVQHRVMSAVGSAGVAPVPVLTSYEHDTNILGRPFFAMEFIDGDIPLDMPRYSQEGFLADTATPQQRQQLVFSGLDAMAGIHAIDWQAAGLQWLDPTNGTAEPDVQFQIDYLRRFADKQLAGRDHPVLYKAFDWLTNNRPDASTGLSWGDSRIGNQIFSDYQCVAVVDWEAACLGPCEMDMGWWVMFDRMSYERMGLTRPAGMPSPEEQVAYYEEKRGKKIAGNIHYWETLAVARFATLMVKLGDRFVAKGYMPEEQSIARDNDVATQLSEMVG